MKTRQRMPWLYLLAVMVVCYGGAALWAHWVSNSMIFLPQYGTRTEPAGAIRIRVSDTSTVSAVFLPNPSARFTVWFFHGNAETVADLLPHLRAFNEQGFSAFAVEYPGYGVSDGIPTEESIYAANLAALKYLRDERKIPVGDVILHGRSVGGGPATELATCEQFGGLVLESAFVSTYRVMTRWPLLPGDKFTNLRKMSRVRCPVLMIHGRQDTVIPFWHGEALFRAAPSRKQHFWVDQAGHNDLVTAAGRDYWRALAGFAADLDRGSPAERGTGG